MDLSNYASVEAIECFFDVEKDIKILNGAVLMENLRAWWKESS